MYTKRHPGWTLLLPALYKASVWALQGSMPCKKHLQSRLDFTCLHLARDSLTPVLRPHRSAWQQHECAQYSHPVMASCQSPSYPSLALCSSLHAKQPFPPSALPWCCGCGCMFSCICCSRTHQGSQDAGSSLHAKQLFCPSVFACSIVSVAAAHKKWNGVQVRNLRERLEEEHQALLTREQDKAALELRIARLTKLILHSTRITTSTAAARKQRISLLRSFSEHLCPTVSSRCCCWKTSVRYETLRLVCIPPIASVPFQARPDA